MSLYEGAVKKPIMTSLCFLAVAIFGLFSLSKLPVDLYPDIDTNTIMVMTSYDGASASDIGGKRVGFADFQRGIVHMNAHVAIGVGLVHLHRARAHMLLICGISIRSFASVADCTPIAVHLEIVVG